MRLRRLASSLLLLGCVAITTTTPAFADEPTTIDIVVLRNGAQVRGHISEIVPEDHVVLIKESGDSLRIAWAEIDRVALGVGRTDPVPVVGGAGGVAGTVPVVGADTAPPPMSGPRAMVHLDAPRHVSLYRIPAGTEKWVLACTSPCDIELPVGDDYRVQGTDVKRSDTFRLNVVNGNATIRVDPSSLGGSIMGGVLATAGGITALTGLLVLPSKDTRVGGVVALAIGLGLLVGGFLIYRASSQTNVTLGVVAPSKKEATAGPTWQTATAGVEPHVERAFANGAWGTTLFSRSF